MNPLPASSRTPAPGQLARVRTRHWLVEEVEPSPNDVLVRLACLEDDAQGELLEVVWNLELDAELLDGEAWSQIGQRGFDPPRHFGAYLWPASG